MVVTGLGAIGAHGVGIAALADALGAGRLSTTPVVPHPGLHRPGCARTALLTSGLDLSALLPAARARRMSPPGRLAVAATTLALAEAGLATAGPEAHLATAVVVGTAFGPALVTEQLVAQILRQGPEAASPALFTESVASAPAAQIALTLAARGPSLAITEREASDLLALAAGARVIAAGAADRAVVAVVEEMTPLLHGVLGRFRALAEPDPSGVETARPFDRRRSGYLAGEGACAVVLEAAGAAAARGVRPLARVVAVARGFDASAPSWDWGAGEEALAHALARGLDRAGVARDSVDVVVSGASGARRGDRLEAAVLRRVLGSHRQRLPPVTAPKGTTGEYGGGFLAAALLIAAGRVAPPTRGFAEADPGLGIVPAPAFSAPRRSLVTALAAGGAAAWIVLDAA